MNPSFDPPESNTAEISVLGTGGGYGECSIIHLGNNSWVVVDSCIDPLTHSSLPLNYLKKMHVDVANDVKLIICTHWHDDHILGISELLENCKNAKLSLAKTTDRVKFLSFVSLDFQKLRSEATASSTFEINRCFDILKSRQQDIISAVQDRLLISLDQGGNRNEIISLSPSDYIISEFDKEISTLITEFGDPNQKIVFQTPNTKSIVLFLKLGNHRAILGADLEVTEDIRHGWLNIINSCQSIDKKASHFKVPHHGSENGYHSKIWIELLKENPLSTLTPWNRNNKLPTPDMLKQLITHTDRLFMTSKLLKDKPKDRKKEIEKIISRQKRNLREDRYHFGLIQSRIDFCDPNAEWEVALFGNAFHVN